MKAGLMICRCMLQILSIFFLAIAGSFAASAAGDKPNILVIWGDDIGTWNISHNNRGMM